MTRSSASDLHTVDAMPPSLQFLQVSLETIPEISQPQTAAYRRQGQGRPIVLLPLAAELDDTIPRWQR